MKEYLKKSLFPLLVIMIVALIAVMAVSALAGDDVITITTQEEFDKFVENSASNSYAGVNIFLEGDFTLKTFIGPQRGDTAHYFAGRLVGGGHTITMTGCGRSDVFGAFSGTKGAVISDLKVTGKLRKGFWADNVGGIVCEAINTTFYDCSFAGFAEGAKLHAGGIAGIATSSSFMRCHVNAQVTATEEAGGIVGRAVDCTISDCTYGYYDYKIPISGDKYIGGIVGYAVNVDIYDCVNSVRVGYNTDTAHYCGGIVGCYDGDLWITSCINEGNVTGGRSVGGIVGAPANKKTDNHRSISYVINRGTITMTPVKDHGGAGGIAGILTNVTLNNARNDGDVVAASSDCGGNFGGIAGVAEYSEIYLSMNYGNVTGPGSSVNVVSKTGGIVGWIRDGVKEDVDLDRAVCRCGNNGDIKGFGENIGAFIGLSDKGGASYCINSGKLNDTTNETRYSTDCVSVKNANYSAAILAANTAMGSSAASLWGLDAKGLPTIIFDGVGSKNYPYLISSLNELKMLAANVNTGRHQYSGYYFLLKADIVDDGTLAPIGDTLNLSNGLLPAFSGKFDGDGHTVYLKMKPSGGTCAALFGFTYKADIRNLRTAGYVVGGLSNSYNSSSDFITVPAAAGICAKAVNTLVRNCQNDANIQGTISGGIVGMAEANSSLLVKTERGSRIPENTLDSVVNCLNRGEINGTVIAGGIIGRMSFEGSFFAEILHCVNDGAAKVMYYHEKTDAETFIGAIVGCISNNASNARVRQCFWRADDGTAVLCGTSSVIGDECASYTGDTVKNITNFAVYDDSVCWSSRGDHKTLADDSILVSDYSHPYIYAFDSHDHSIPDTVFYQMDAGIGFNGHKTYYGCLTCGKLYYDESMNTEVKSDAELTLKTLIRAKSSSSAVTKLDGDGFFNADEVYEYVKNHPMRTYSSIELGFDIETDVPILYSGDLTVSLNGYRWLYSGASDSSVFAEDKSVSGERTFTIVGNNEGKGERGIVEIYEFSYCRLLGELEYTTEINISDTNVNNTSTSQDGGMISVYYRTWIYPTITLENVTVTGSSAGGNGGAICLYTWGSDMAAVIYLKNTVFDSCSATNGGAIYVDGVSALIEGDGDSKSQFRHCQAYEKGGALYLEEGVFSTSGKEKYRDNPNGISGITFIGNYAGMFANYETAKRRGIDEEACGGAIAISMPKGFEITDCVFQANLASGHGGAIYQIPMGVTVFAYDYVSDCSFMDDVALGLGYEIYFSDGELSDLTIQNSKASKMENVAYAKTKYKNDTDIRPIKIFVRTNDKDVKFSSISYSEGAALGSAVANGNVIFVAVFAAVIVAAVVTMILLKKAKKKKENVKES